MFDEIIYRFLDKVTNIIERVKKFIDEKKKKYK